MATGLVLLALEGDGIGPEIMAATLHVLKAVQPQIAQPFEIRRQDIGFKALEASGSTIPQPVIDAARIADGIILGPVSHNAYPSREKGGLNPSGVLRKELELYANIRPAKSWHAVPRPASSEVDLVVVRENLEGFYADRNMASGPGEFMPEPGVALAMRKITKKGSLRIARAAFDLAMTRPRKHVTAIHKANVMRLSDGLFLECTRAIAKDYPEVTYDECLVDAAAALLVRDPNQFDVIVTTNMFGDILSDLASELSGGLGLAGSLNLGPHTAMAQAQHGSAPDIASQNKANPISLILSLAMLLRHLGEAKSAGLIERAISETLPKTRTIDLGGTASTSDFTHHLCASIEAHL